MTARRLRRYRLVCTVRDARRCRWASRSWRARKAPRIVAPLWASNQLTSHVRDWHPEAASAFIRIAPRRWRPWLRWAALAAVALATLAAVTAAAVSTDIGRWWW